MPNKKFDRHAKREDGGVAIPAGLFIGMGIGFMTNNFVPWMFIGLGVGFLIMLFVHLLFKGKR